MNYRKANFLKNIKKIDKSMSYCCGSSKNLRLFLDFKTESGAPQLIEVFLKMKMPKMIVIEIWIIMFFFILIYWSL